MNLQALMKQAQSMQKNIMDSKKKIDEHQTKQSKQRTEHRNTDSCLIPHKELWLGRSR